VQLGPRRTNHRLQGEVENRTNVFDNAGSHGTVYAGGRFAIVKDLKKELGPGLPADMCKQLGIRKEDL